MTSDRPEGADPDPGRRLMIVALVGAALLAMAVLAAMGYFVWQRINQDRDAASAWERGVAVVSRECTSGS